MTEWKPTSYVFANIQPMTATNGRLLVPIICEYISLYKFIEQDFELNETNEFYETDHEEEYGDEHASNQEFAEEEEVKDQAEVVEVRVSP